METRKVNSIKMQQLLVAVSIVLFILKVIAWYITSSVAILTDAMESTVNIIAGFIGLYSLILSSKPRDKEHPYGHGKVEFLSSAIEGILISIAGIIIIYKATLNFIHPPQLKQLDYGLIIIAVTAIINYIVGYLCIQKGKKENSPILIASGAHLQSDTYSTIGLLAGIGLILLTGYTWLDSAAAILFAFIIIYTGYRIIRKAISGIMDESDTAIIGRIVNVLNEHKDVNWIDVHNMRVINYAGFYHIDCHLTVPYYINVNEAHKLLDALTDLLKKHFDNSVEFFIHIDGCITAQCAICNIPDCPARQTSFIKHIDWTNDNILSNQKHTLLS